MFFSDATLTKLRARCLDTVHDDTLLHQLLTVLGEYKSQRGRLAAQANELHRRDVEIERLAELLEENGIRDTARDDDVFSAAGQPRE